MSKATHKVQKKLMTFQMNGLKSYKKYLKKELERTSRKKSKKKYRKYLESEQERAGKKLKKLKARLA